MGRVDCFELPGLDLWFNSNDHLPPHFHAEKADEWEVTVRFLRRPGEMMQVEWGSEPGARDRRALTDAAERHRDALLLEWERKTNPKAPGPLR